ncbi:MAG: bifunctional nuclease family protein [Coriobacteriaceae bacterium]|nr:bifunctional nuclease family protein [Coriobacteriaceae bacterium]
MVRVDVAGIMMADGPVPSVIILRERKCSSAPCRTLSIKTGAIEAKAIAQGLYHEEPQRPITHDLLASTIGALGAIVRRVVIARMDRPVFYANVVLASKGSSEETFLDARPSDAIALAARTGAPIFVEDDVMNRAGSTNKAEDEGALEQEYVQFDEFVQHLSPNDF